jgi:hypothetical protein
VNFRIVLLTAIMTLFGNVALAQNAKSGVTPVLSGTYILQVMHFCQAAIANSPSGVVPTNSGDSNYNVGTVDFDPTAGQATTSGASLDGAALIVNGIGNPIAPGPFSQTFPTRTRARRLRSSRAMAT